MVRGELDAADEALEPALAGAERIGDRRLVYEGLTQRASMLAERGRLVEAIVLWEGAIRGLEAAGDEQLADNAWVDLAVWSIDIDPAAALSAHQAIIERQRRKGDRRTRATVVGNAAEIAVGSGEWDWAVAQLTDVLGDDQSPSDRVVTMEQLTIIAALRGQPEAEARLAEAKALAGDNPTLLDILDDRTATIEWVAGRHREAATIWRHYAGWSNLNATSALPRAARASLWAGDITGARADLDALVATGVHGAVIDAWLATIGAGIAAAEGRIGDARREHREALTRWRALGQPWFESLTCLDLVLLLDVADLDVDAAAERAREVFTQLGAWPFMDMLDTRLARAGGKAPATRPVSTTELVRG